MSNIQNTQYIEGMWEDFLEFLSKEEYGHCRAIQDAVGENGFENDALRMHKMVNGAQHSSAFDIVGEQFKAMGV